MIQESKDLSDVPNEKADYFIDRIVAVDEVVVGETWEDYSNTLLEFCKPKSKFKAIVHNFWFIQRKFKKEDDSTQQKMPGHSDWFKFLWNGHHVKSTDVRKKFTRSVLLKKRKYGT